MYEESWFNDNNAEACSLLETLDLSDDYSSEQDHTWPGLDDRIEEAFSASITGYLNIGGAAEYKFVITSRGSVKLLFDDSTTPVVSFNANQETTRNGTVTLSSGRHLMRLYYSNWNGAARLLVRYMSEAASLPLTSFPHLYIIVYHITQT